jgi:hypothetical protein
MSWVCAEPVEVKMAREFIEQCCVELKNIKVKGVSSSYGWKHAAEGWFRAGNVGAAYLFRHAMPSARRQKQRHPGESPSNNRRTGNLTTA